MLDRLQMWGSGQLAKASTPLPVHYCSLKYPFMKKKKKKLDRKKIV